MNHRGPLGNVGLIAVRLVTQEKILEEDNDTGLSPQEDLEHPYNQRESSMNLKAAIKKYLVLVGSGIASVIKKNG